MADQQGVIRRDVLSGAAISFGILLVGPQVHGAANNQRKLNSSLTELVRKSKELATLAYRDAEEFKVFGFRLSSFQLAIIRRADTGLIVSDTEIENQIKKMAKKSSYLSRDSQSSGIVTPANFNLVRSIAGISTVYSDTVVREAGLRNSYYIAAKDDSGKSVQSDVKDFNRFVANLQIRCEAASDIERSDLGHLLKLVNSEIEVARGIKGAGVITTQQESYLAYRALSALKSKGVIDVATDNLYTPYAWYGPISSIKLIPSGYTGVRSFLPKTTHQLGNIEFFASTVFHNAEEISNSGPRGQEVVKELPEMVKAVCVLRFAIEERFLNEEYSHLAPDTELLLDLGYQSYSSLASSIFDFTKEEQVSSQLELLSSKFIDQLNTLPDAMAAKIFANVLRGINGPRRTSQEKALELYRKLSLTAESSPESFNSQGYRMSSARLRSIARTSHSEENFTGSEQIFAAQNIIKPAELEFVPASIKSDPIISNSQV